MIFCEWIQEGERLRGRILGWARDGQMYASVLVGQRGYEVALSDMLLIEDGIHHSGIPKKRLKQIKAIKDKDIDTSDILRSSFLDSSGAVIVMWAVAFGLWWLTFNAV